MTNQVIILDDSLDRNEVRVIKSIHEHLGINIINDTGKTLFLTPEFVDGKLDTLVVKT